MARERFEAQLRRDGCYVVSEGTLLAQDLLPRFLSLVEELSPEHHRPLAGRFPLGVRGFPDHPWWSSEKCASLLNEDVFDTLNELAPDGFWFGSNEGDGACFGFWPAEEDD